MEDLQTHVKINCRLKLKQKYVDMQLICMKQTRDLPLKIPSGTEPNKTLFIQLLERSVI